MTYCIIKVKYTWMRDKSLPTSFAIMITIANTRGFGAFLIIYTYNKYIYIYYIYYIKVKVKSSMARSLPVENLLPQNVGSIINYLQ